MIPPNAERWIDYYISDPNLRQSLHRAHDQIYMENRVEFYTDGSLTKESTKQETAIRTITIYIWAAAPYSSYDSRDVSITAALNLWPSSTRAELAAIFLTLLAVGEHTKLYIYTDSQ